MARSVNFKLFGNWVSVRKLMNSLPQNLKETGLASQKLIADQFVRTVKAHLRSQDIPGWTPLSYKYANSKLKKLGSTDILLATWKYYESIRSWRERNVYMVGVPVGETYKDGTSVSRVAAIHEAWSRIPGKPYRPLWGYTFNQDFKGLAGIQRILNKHFKRILRAKGYPVQTLKL